MIYLDYAATTPVSQSAIDNFMDVCKNTWDNPSSTLREPGIAAKRLITESRKIFAKEMNVESENIFFTSGATEAANWILRGFADDYLAKYIIADPMSHPCVYNTCEYLAHKKDVRWFPVRAGVIDVDWLKHELNKIKDDLYKTIVCVTYVNNETGVVQDIAKIADIVHSFPNCYLMLDMTQAVGHYTSIDQNYLDYDFAFGSAHKFGGLKGTGFVYISNPDLIKPLLIGGHQENNRRAGTENVAGIYSMAEQFRLVRSNAIRYMKSMKDEDLWEYIMGMLPDFCHVNFIDNRIIYSIMSITLDGMNGQDVVSKLALQGIYISAGSACSTGEDKPSRVLMEAGLSEDEARRTIRVSFDGMKTTADEINTFIKALYALEGR